MKIALKQNMKFELEYLTHEICTIKVNGKITEILNNTMKLSTHEICTIAINRPEGSVDHSIRNTSG